MSHTTNKVIDNIMKNENIHINKEENTYEICPYNKELTIGYVKQCIHEILSTVEEFVLVMPMGYYLDGLSETNHLLVQTGRSEIYNKHTQEALTL